MTFRVGEQAVYAASDVAEVEGDGGKSAGTGVELSFGQGMAPVMEILMREFKRVERGAGNGRNAGECTAEPRFTGRKVQHAEIVTESGGCVGDSATFVGIAGSRIWDPEVRTQRGSSVAGNSARRTLQMGRHHE